MIEEKPVLVGDEEDNAVKGNMIEGTEGKAYHGEDLVDVNGVVMTRADMLKMDK